MKVKGISSMVGERIIEGGELLGAALNMYKVPFGVPITLFSLGLIRLLNLRQQASPKNVFPFSSR